MIKKSHLSLHEPKSIPYNKSPETTTQRQSIRAQCSTSRVYEQKHILCQKQNKYMTGSNSHEVLQKCVTIEADVKLHEATIVKLDDRVSAMHSREAVAAEVHFHRSCYRLYTKVDSYVNRCPSSNNPVASEYSIIEDKAFQHVCHCAK